MSIRRHARSNMIGGGKGLSSSRAAEVIKAGVDRGKIETREYVLRQGERLDSLAGRFYKDATLWWVIAAASGIGWGMQIPPGTLLRIPKSLAVVKAMVG